VSRSISVLSYPRSLWSMLFVYQGYFVISFSALHCWLVDRKDTRRPVNMLVVGLLVMTI